MNFTNYVRDHRYLILFFVLTILFISSVVGLAPNSGITVDNMLYMDLVSLVFFIIYLFIDYISKKRYYLIIEELISKDLNDISGSLPDPGTREQGLYNKILDKISRSQRQRIDELIEEKRANQEFTATWVHEIKTPISVIRLLIDSRSDNNQEEVLKSIEEEVDKIETQVEQALFYSKIDDFSKDYFVNDISVGRVVRDVVKRNAHIFIGKKISVTIEEKDFKTLSDKKWLEFIIHQILSNSLKYTGCGGSISINFEEDKKENRIVIMDNGIGIKDEDVHRVFDKGFTGFTGRSYAKSTGMGLYLAKKLACKLGHDITIESEYGRYTSTTVHLPKLSDYFSVTKM